MGIQDQNDIKCLLLCNEKLNYPSEDYQAKFKLIMLTMAGNKEAYDEACSRVNSIHQIGEIQNFEGD